MIRSALALLLTAFSPSLSLATERPAATTTSQASASVEDQRANVAMAEVPDEDLPLTRAPAVVARYKSGPTYACNPQDPAGSLRMALKKAAIEDAAFAGKDFSGLYRKDGVIYYGQDPGDEMASLSVQRLTWENRKPDTRFAWVKTAELITNEDWKNGRSCVIWFNATDILSVEEVQLDQALVDSLRFWLGVRAGSNETNSSRWLGTKNSSQDPIETISKFIFPPSLDLGDTSRLILRVGGVSAQIPFSLLRYRDGPAGARFAMVMAFSFQEQMAYTRIAKPLDPAIERTKSIIERIHDDVIRKDFRNTVIVGNPFTGWDSSQKWPLIEDSEVTARRLQATFPGATVLLGREARKADVIRRMREADLVSFSTHGVADRFNPNSQTYLILADGYLGSRDLRNDFRFEHNPVVLLNACQMALGKPFEGGTYGLTRAFLKRGAAQVVSNLWNVDARRNGELMAMIATRIAAGQGAEFAARDVIADAAVQDPDDPSSWGAFIVSGGPSLYCGSCR